MVFQGFSSSEWCHLSYSCTCKPTWDMGIPEGSIGGIQPITRNKGKTYLGFEYSGRSRATLISMTERPFRGRVLFHTLAEQEGINSAWSEKLLTEGDNECLIRKIERMINFGLPRISCLTSREAMTAHEHNSRDISCGQQVQRSRFGVGAAFWDTFKVSGLSTVGQV